ncbi:MAG: YncE family protein [Ferruginibacter sp.]
MKKNLLKWLLPAVLLMQACSKDDTGPSTPVTPAATGLFVLSEGNYGLNNTKLGFYNLSTAAYSADYFVQQNPTQTGLGDTGNDAIIYGGKMYIVMNVTSQVVVLNAQTGAFLARINFGTAPNFKNPRYATAVNGKVYVTAYDNTVNIVDTTALSITGSIAVGANPEGIAVSGNNLYIANSGAYNYPDFDSTVSVVSLSTGAEIKKIKVGLNPNKVEVASNGDVYVSSYGNFGSIPANISVINASTNELKATLGTGFAYSHVRISGNIAYFYNNYGGVGTAKVYNTTTGAVIRNEFITDGTAITTPYGINVDAQNGDVYITDAKDYTSAGAVTCFSSAGVKKFSFTTTSGISPNKVLFKR